MTTLKYTVIKSKEQYNDYCNLVEKFLSKPEQTQDEEAEVELLTTLIEVWDQEHSTTKQLDPVQLLRSIIKDHKFRPGQVMKIMGISGRGHFYDILNYQKGFSKGVIRKLAAYFKVSQEAFNRPYILKKNPTKAVVQSTSLARVVVKRSRTRTPGISKRGKQKKIAATATKKRALQPA